MRVGILGGGLTGLALGYFLKERGVDFEILEKESECGGLCRSIQEDGFTFDIGGHILFSKEEILSFILGLLGENKIEHRRNTKIFYKGGFVKYPFENGLADLPKEENFECLHEFIKVLIQKEKGLAKPPANFEEWIYTTFGKGIAEKYLIPYNRKIWKFDLRKMATFWIADRLPMPPIEDVIKSSIGIETEGYTHQLHFYYPLRGGIQSLPRSLEKEVGDKITTNFCVREVHHENGVWVVSDGERKKKFDKIISTIPIHRLVSSLKDVPSQVEHAAENLKYNSLIVIALGLDVKKVSDFHWLYFPDAGLLTHRVVFLSNYSPHLCPPGKSSIIAEITYRAGDEISRMEDQALMEDVIQGLHERNIIDKKKICFKKILRSEYAYVIYDLDYQRNIKTVTDFFGQLGIELCGRFSEFKYLNMDACIRSAGECIGRVFPPLSPCGGGRV
jgi:protoporphyrinogen oxidase